MPVDGRYGIMPGASMWYRRLVDSEVRYMSRKQRERFLGWPIWKSRQISCHLNLQPWTWAIEEAALFHQEYCDSDIFFPDPSTEAADFNALRIVLAANQHETLTPRSLGIEEELIVIITMAADPAMVSFVLMPCLIIMSKLMSKNCETRKLLQANNHWSYLPLKLSTSWTFMSLVNQTIKMIVRGDRPYWVQPRFLLQYRTTCESGGGFPSGHMASSACVVTFLSLELVKKILFKKMAFSKKILMIVLIFVACQSILFLVGLSRVATSSHFMHQVLAGYVLGSVISCFCFWKLSDEYISALMNYRSLDNKRHSKWMPLVKFISIFVILTLFQVFIQLFGDTVSTRGMSYTQKMAVLGCADQSKTMTSSILGAVAERSAYTIGNVIIPIMSMKTLAMTGDTLVAHVNDLELGSLNPPNVQQPPTPQSAWKSWLDRLLERKNTILYRVAYLSKMQVSLFVDTPHLNVILLSLSILGLALLGGLMLYFSAALSKILVGGTKGFILGVTPWIVSYWA
eukprot:GHVH01002997.1.p1 GENE.GHVH01002997.1~~GHVH01002997.1.p1  ORF type:complete len:513 (-),score=30.44 GHVH01002997.1:865-2403(-)